MELKVIEHGQLELRQVFNPIKLVSPDDEEIFVCMRDSGYEVKYEGKIYSFKEGEVECIS